MAADIDYPLRPRTVEELFLRAQVAAQQRVDPRSHWSFYNTAVDARESWDMPQRITTVGQRSHFIQSLPQTPSELQLSCCVVLCC